MSRITPGPWKVHGRDTRGLPHSLVGGDTLIAKVYSKCYGDVEQENANAMLIAAAPDMFAALVKLHDSLKELADSGDAGQMVNDDVEVARAAIAKAIA